MIFAEFLPVIKVFTGSLASFGLARLLIRVIAKFLYPSGESFNYPQLRLAFSCRSR